VAKEQLKILKKAVLFKKIEKNKKIEKKMTNPIAKVRVGIREETKPKLK